MHSLFIKQQVVVGGLRVVRGGNTNEPLYVEWRQVDATILAKRNKFPTSYSYGYRKG